MGRIKPNGIKRAFTIVEAVVVMCILSVLAGIIIASYASVQRNSASKAAMNEARDALDIYLATTINLSQKELVLFVYKNDKYYIFGFEKEQGVFYEYVHNRDRGDGGLIDRYNGRDDIDTVVNEMLINSEDFNTPIDAETGYPASPGNVFFIDMSGGTPAAIVSPGMPAHIRMYTGDLLMGRPPEEGNDPGTPVGDPYTVTYLPGDANEDSVPDIPLNMPEPATGYANGEFEISSLIPTQNGYFFAGWEYSSNGYTSAHLFSARETFVMPDSAVTLTAKWSGSGMYSISYDVNGGVALPTSSTEQYAGGASVTITKSTTKEGFVFCGWKLTPEGIALDNLMLYDTFIMPLCNVVATAQWGTDFTITFTDIVNDIPNQDSTVSIPAGEELSNSTLADALENSPINTHGGGFIINNYVTSGTAITANGCRTKTVEGNECKLILNEHGLDVYVRNNREDNYLLGNSITLTENWTSIGYTPSLTLSFYGKFYGGLNASSANTIYNMNIVYPSYEYHGFFASLSSATVKYLKLEGGSISTNTGYSSEIGFIAGCATGKTIVSDCSIIGMTLTNTASSASSHGGIVGCIDSQNPDVTIQNCYIDSATTITSSGCIIGGIVGKARTNKRIRIINCVNEANVTCTYTGDDYEAIPGGIVGYALGGVEIIDCHNIGLISGKRRAAGIIGYAGNNADYSASPTITRCYNTGKVNISYFGASNCIGGIVGYLDASMARISECYNTGAIYHASYYAGSPAAGSAGGIIGQITNKVTSSAQIVRCYNVGYLKATNVGAIICINDGSITFSSNCYLTNNYQYVTDDHSSTYGTGYTIEDFANASKVVAHLGPDRFKLSTNRISYYTGVLTNIGYTNDGADTTATSFLPVFFD